MLPLAFFFETVALSSHAELGVPSAGIGEDIARISLDLAVTIVGTSYRLYSTLLLLSSTSRESISNTNH